MKNIRIVIACCMLMISIGCKAQFVGQFTRMQDGHIYFAICNQSYYVQPLGWFVVNEETADYKTNQQFVAPGQTLLFGPSTIGWKWHRKDKFVAIGTDGLQVEWVCPYSDRGAVSFNSEYGSHSGVRGSCNVSSHKCNGYVDANGDNYCDNCKPTKCHAVNHQPL